jgi:hypothetical protein
MGGSGGGGGFLAPVLKPILSPIMDGIGLTPKIPEAHNIAPPPSPTSEDPGVKAATEAAMGRAQEDERKARGRASTILGGAKEEDSSIMGKVKRTLGG